MLNLFFITLSLWSVGAIGSLFLKKNDALANYWSNFFAVLGAISGLLTSGTVLLFGSSFSFNLNSNLPLLSISLRVDQLSAFFIFIISLIALAASIYAFGYVKHYYKKYNLGALGFFYNLFLIGMVLVVSSSQVLFFLIAWEIMSLASYFLVIFEHKEKNNLRAGLIYFIMTHIGTAFIILSLLLLYNATGSLDFQIIKTNMAMVSPLLKDIIFLLALVGFGTKAGMIPFHIWLPSAHPAAPSHVSTLMSGVMIKTGIYMLIRLTMDIMPNVPLWWGIAILLLGAISSLLGVLYALTEHDIKRLLAYHSIENIGIILMGFGSALIFWFLGLNQLVVLSLAASLFHTLNHAVFKALLFLGAGSVISQTHTRNMEEYGGLIKLMPATAFFFLIGSLAISALPPFNGFYSEWVTFQSLFAGIGQSAISIRWVFILAAGSLAFTGGLAAMCFVKAFGATFLARPRSEEVKHAKESGISMQIGMAIPAILTLVIGISAGKILEILKHIANDLVNFRYVSNSFTPSVSMPLILFALTVTIVAVYLITSILTRQRKVKVGITWDCGTNLGPRMEITSTGFARSIIIIFKGILKPTKQTNIEYHDEEMRYFPKSSSIELGILDVYHTFFYFPVHRFMIMATNRVKKVQNGNINMYLLYIFVTLFALLFIASI